MGMDPLVEAFEALSGHAPSAPVVVGGVRTVTRSGLESQVRGASRVLRRNRVRFILVGPLEQDLAAGFEFSTWPIGYNRSGWRIFTAPDEAAESSRPEAGPDVRPNGPPPASP